MIKVTADQRPHKGFKNYNVKINGVWVLIVTFKFPGSRIEAFFRNEGFHSRGFDPGFFNTTINIKPPNVSKAIEDLIYSVPIIQRKIVERVWNL